MSTTPFERQRLPSDPIVYIEYQIAQGNAVAGAALLDAIERCLDRPLDDGLRELVCKFSIAGTEERGRPPTFDAEMDVAFDKLDRRYPALLRYEKRKDRKARIASTANRASPSERAYERLRRHMGAFSSISCWESLRNKHSAWKHGRLHSTENDVDSEDFEAEIEVRFPSWNHK